MTDQNGDKPEQPAPPNPLAPLALGPMFNPFAPGSYEWHKLGLMAATVDDPTPKPVNVYILTWSGENGRQACNFVGEDTMRDFLRKAQEIFSGLYIPGA